MLSPVRHVAQTVLEQAWQSFVETGHVAAALKDQLDPLVYRSWQRCAPLLNPLAEPRPATLGDQALERLLAAHAHLLAIARPFMEDIYQYTADSDCTVLLADSTACILDRLGNPPAPETLNYEELRPGVYWDEGHMGTNALALALEAVPIQVFGAEHYFQRFHNLACSAAPIHDVSGRLAGVVAMAGRLASCHPHTLTTVMATARAISNQLQVDSYFQEANRRMSELNSVFGAISEGVISWNREGTVIHMNTQAGSILGINPWRVTGRPLADWLQWPPGIVEAIDQAETLRDVEVSLGVNGRFVDCLVSLQPIFEGMQLVGYTATLRPIEQVHRLVHRMLGAQATLRLEDLQGSSTRIREVQRQVRIAARGTAPVLLHGEDGVGKGSLAQIIHTESPRAGQPFIAVNCLSLPHELMVGEFLGYESGAFRGALADGRPSKFELADGGTLFLDDVEGLSLETQAALLHVIDTGHVMRWGGARPVPVNVRVIAATSADLEQRVASGEFLPDLYRRFGVFVLKVPPLRERIEDLPLLVERFLARITQRMERAAFISDDALDALCRYPWPGNIRELESVLERAVAACTDGVLRVRDLPDNVRSEHTLPPGALLPLPVLSLAEAEREAIIRAGWACQGRITSMAQKLGVGRTTLWRKIKNLNIDPQKFKR